MRRPRSPGFPSEGLFADAAPDRVGACSTSVTVGPDRTPTGG